MGPLILQSDRRTGILCDSVYVRVLAFSLLFLWNASYARADVGIVVYESKGVDSRRTNSGHIALIASNLCAEGIDQVRSCSAGEQPGVVITRYLRVAYAYDRSLFVAPFGAHFYATGDPELIPAVTSDDTLETMQAAYWREHLRPYLPPFPQERYEQLRHQYRFDTGRTVRGILSLETVLGAMEPNKKSYTASIALVDPVTRDLIPNGHWREAIGAAHVRSSIIVTAPARPEQETRLIAFIAAENKKPFQAMADNCSDFVERGLLTVFGDSGLRFRPRLARVADAWITNPLAVLTDFVGFARRERVPIHVERVPMIAGTRAPTAAIHSLTRGALVPNPEQGKVLFGAKLAMNVVNPLLGVAALTVDKLSRFTDLDQLAHDWGGGDLPQLSNQIRTEGKGSEQTLEARRREQVKLFGTSRCWKAKDDSFRLLTAQAYQDELLTRTERDLLLKRDRPFLPPRWYAQTSAQKEKGDSGFGAGRTEIRKLALLSDRQSRVTAFRLMLSVINYDLSSEPDHRRTSDKFDQDWTLFLDVARKNGIRVPAEPVVTEGVSECSCRQFDQGGETRDAFADSLGLRHGLVHEARQIVLGRTR